MSSHRGHNCVFQILPALSSWLFLLHFLQEEDKASHIPKSFPLEGTLVEAPLEGTLVEAPLEGTLAFSKNRFKCIKTSRRRP
jgi:hypothetical protein